MQPERVERGVLRPLCAKLPQTRQNAVDLVQTVDGNRGRYQLARDEIARREAEPRGDSGHRRERSSTLLARVQQAAVELNRDFADGGTIEPEGVWIDLKHAPAQFFLQRPNGLLGGRSGEFDLDAYFAHASFRIGNARRESKLDRLGKRRSRHRVLRTGNLTRVAG